MSSPLSSAAFLELAGRYLSGHASAAEVEALGKAMLQNAELAREFAGLARFESLLRMTCRRDAKAFLEFAALEAASEPATEAPLAALPAPAAPRTAVATTPRKTTSWHITVPPWLRMAAVFAALVGIASLWITHRRAPLPSVAQTAPAAAQFQSPVPHKVVLLAPRTPETSPAVDAGTGSSPAEAASQPLSLAQRLDDFYLPSVSLRQVRAQDAATWLTAQLREHNYARRPDLNQLTLQMPHAVAGRFVTLESGPISFKKAVEIVSTLAGGEAVISEEGIQITDHETPVEPAPEEWQDSPWGKTKTQENAAALGIALDDATLKAEAGGGVRLRLPQHQQQALDMFAAAQHQLASLTPLSFVPLLVPSGAAGPERVLSAATVEVIQQQLAAATAGTLPVVTLSFGSTGRGAPLLDSSGSAAITLKVTPVGEMNQVTIEPATPVVVQPGNLLAGNTSNAPVPVNGSSFTAVDALLTSSQGVVATVDGTTTVLYTPEGIPIPPGYEYLYGFAAAPDTSADPALVLVPLP